MLTYVTPMYLLGTFLARSVQQSPAVLSIAGVSSQDVRWRWGAKDLARGVSLSLLVACSTATIAAMTLPWGFERFGVDPALGSGPLATVIQDLLSILMYFAIVTAMVR